MTCLFIVYFQILYAQEQSRDHAYDHHHRHSEISLGAGAVLMPWESAWGFGLHLHGTTGITGWMGAGAGFELITGEHTHYTITGLLHF
ncbi:MAG TPA: hypothetical protein ENO05_02500, partial [Bacteroides sp.]|nr:hypothetical protein [Bacteroides sp.]